MEVLSTLATSLMIWQVETKKSSLEFWRRSLNPLTWTEILRQILFAAGFGAKQNASRREALSKVCQIMFDLGCCDAFIMSTLNLL